MRIDEIEFLIGADVSEVEKADKQVQGIRDRINKNPATQKVDGDDKQALASMDRVEKAAKKVVSQKTMLILDTDISRTEKNLERAKQRLETLEVKALGGFDVTADTRRAESSLARAQAQLEALTKARAEVVVEVDPMTALQKLKAMFGKAEEEAEASGKRAGSSFSRSLDGATRGAGEKVGDLVGGDIEGTLTAALVGIPVAGGIVLAAVGIGKAITGGIRDGLGQELGSDRLQALAGLDEAAALRLSQQAAQAYTEGFGESIEKNMDTTRLALQFDLIDPETSNRDAKAVVEGLAGIADVIGEDVQPVARTVTQLLRNGLAGSAREAFDIIAAGQREGVNLGDDLLDTLSEYGSTFKALGFTGGQTLGILNQGLKAGAPNTDFFADSLRELGIRIREGNDETAGFVERLGLVPSELQAAFVEGGPRAGEALDLLFDRLRDVDPIERNRIAVGLLGTQYEDLQFDLSKIDLSNAEQSLNGVEGAAQRMFDTLASNDASKLQQAERNVEVAMDGIKGALAAGFSEPLAQAADWVSQNRGPILDFFGDLVVGALDFSSTLARGTADGAEAIGELVSGPLASLVIAFANVKGLIPGQAEEAAGLKALGQEMQGFRDTTSEAADRLRLGADRIDSWREKAAVFVDSAAAVGYVNDASLRLADAMGVVGSNIDVATLSLDGYDATSLRSSESGRMLEQQLRSAIAALADQVIAAQNAGESQDAVTARYEAGREALAQQMTQMGLSREAAQGLIDTILQTPPDKSTTYNSNADEQTGKVRGLNDQIRIVNGKTVVMDANIAPAVQELTTLQRLIGATVAQQNTVGPLKSGYVFAQPQALGGVMEFMASGGLRGRSLTPMSPVAQVVPPSTWRVVGDRGDVPEAYIPLDGSARSYGILAETMQRMGVQAMGAGGVAGITGPGGPIDTNVTVKVVNKTGIALEDLIDVRIEKSEGRMARRFSGLGL